MKKENFTVKELLEVLKNANSTVEEVQDDIMAIETKLNKDKTYSFVVIEVDQETNEYSYHNDNAVLMSNEALKMYNIEKYTNWVWEKFLTIDICVTKSWTEKEMETPEILFLQDETFQLLFDIEL